jgi:hypothetical protein
MDVAGTMVQRYRDAYLVGRTIVAFGRACKAAGWVIAVIIVGLLFLSLTKSPNGYDNSPFSQGPNPFTTVSAIFVIFFAGAVWVVLHIAGILISASGEILFASLDTAVNSSPFLTDDLKASAMLPRFRSNYGSRLDQISANVNRRARVRLTDQREFVGILRVNPDTGQLRIEGDGSHHDFWGWAVESIDDIPEQQSAST